MEKRKTRGYKITDSNYKAAMKACKKGTPLATRVEEFVISLAHSTMSHKMDLATALKASIKGKKR
jgi:hypothetical protein